MESLATRLKKLVDDLRSNRNSIDHIVLSYQASQSIKDHATGLTSNGVYVSEFMGFPVKINMQLRGQSALVYFNTERAVGLQVRSVIDV